MYLSHWRKVRGGANDAIFSDCLDPRGRRKGNSIGGAILSVNVNFFFVLNDYVHTLHLPI